MDKIKFLMTDTGAQTTQFAARHWKPRELM